MFLLEECYVYNQNVKSTLNTYTEIWREGISVIVKLKENNVYTLSKKAVKKKWVYIFLISNQTAEGSGSKTVKKISNYLLTT